MLFPKATVFHLSAINSDHAPLLIDTNPSEDYCPHPFRFEAIWVRDPRYGGIIRKAWNSMVEGSHTYVLYRKQKLTTKALNKWNREVLGYCNSMIKELSTKISEVQAQDRTKVNARSKAKIQVELNEWLRRNEVLWQQKLRET